MKKTWLFFISLFIFSIFFCSCSTKQDNTLKLTEKGDQIANGEIIFTEKKVAASSDVKPTEYHYILKNKFVAK